MLHSILVTCAIYLLKYPLKYLLHLRYILGSFKRHLRWAPDEDDLLSGIPLYCSLGALLMIHGLLYSLGIYH